MSFQFSPIEELSKLEFNRRLYIIGWNQNSFADYIGRRRTVIANWKTVPVYAVRILEWLELAQAKRGDHVAFRHFEYAERMDEPLPKDCFFCQGSGEVSPAMDMLARPPKEQAEYEARVRQMAKSKCPVCSGTGKVVKMPSLHEVSRQPDSADATG